MMLLVGVAKGQTNENYVNMSIEFHLYDTNAVTIAENVKVRIDGDIVAEFDKDGKLIMLGDVSKDVLMYRILQSWIVANYNQRDMTDMWQRQSEYLLNTLLQQRIQEAQEKVESIKYRLKKSKEESLKLPTKKGDL